MNCRKLSQLDEKFGIARLAWIEAPRNGQVAPTPSAPATRPAVAPPAAVPMAPAAAPAAAPSAAPEPTASAKATKEKGYSSVIAANTKLLNAGLFNPPEKGEGLPQVTRTDFEALYTAHTAEFKRLYKALVTSAVCAV